MTAFLEWLATFLANLGITIWTKAPPAPVVVEAEKVGAAQAQVAILTRAVKTETAIATAEADAPATKAAEVDALEKDQF